MTKKYRNKVPRGSYGSAALLGGFPTTSELDDSWALEFNNVGLVTYSSDPQGWILEFEEVIADQGQTVYIGVKITAPPLPKSRETRFTVFFNHRHNGVLTGYRAVYRDPNLPSNIEPSNDLGVTLVCLLAEIDLSLSNDGTYTATTTHRGGTAPFTYNWTLPAGATQVTGLGNSVVTWKGGDGGNVSVTVSDSDAPSPCTDTRTITVSEATPAPPSPSGGIALGGYAPAVTRKSTIDTNSLAGYRFAEPHANAPTPKDEQWAGINISFWGSEYFCDNSLHRRRVGTQGEIFSEFEVERNYNRLSNSAFDLFLPFYRTETRYELLVRGTYQDRQDPNAVSFNARHPRRQTNFNDFDYEYSSDSFFLVVPGKPGAPVDPLIPPIEPPVYPPTGGQHCALSLRATVINGTDVQFTVETPANYPASGLIKIYRTAPSDAGGISLVKTGNAPTLTLANVESKPALYYATFEPLQSVDYQQGCAMLRSDNLGIEDNVDPSGCCLPGYYRAVAGGPCIPVPVVIPENAIPAKPDAPTATNLHGTDTGAVVTISFVAWPANSRLVRLFQDGVKVRDWDVTQMPRSVEIERLVDYQSYNFTLQGLNGEIAGPLSDATPVTIVSPTLEAAWQAPADNASVTRATALVALAKLKAGAPGPLTVAAYAMRVGGALALDTRDRGLVAPNTRRYTNTLDPRGLDFLGAMSLAFEVMDALGLKARALIRVNISSSLAKATRYEHIRVDDPRGRALGKVALTTLLDEGEGWVDALVMAPGDGVVLPYDDFAAMETRLRDWQSVALDEVFAPLSAAPSSSMEVVLRFTPARLETRYLLGATGALRTRQISDEKIEVLTFEPFRVVEVTPDGVEQILDIAARGFENVIDARRWREDKVVVVTQTEIWVCELDESAADWRVILGGENRPCVGVETIGDKFYLAFADEGGSRVWAHDGTDPVRIYDGTAQIVSLRAANAALAWVTADNEIWIDETRSDPPGVTAPIYAHNAPVVDVLFDQNGDVAAFADATHVYKLTDNGTTRGAALIGQMPASVRSISWYKGSNALARLTAGSAASAAIYSVAPNNAWSGIWTLGQGATGIDGVGRFLVTHVEGGGDPLMGGKPAVTTETLVGVARVPNGGGYVAFIEAAKQTSDNSTRAAGVERLVAVWENGTTA